MKNNTIDFLRLVLCFFIVAIHFHAAVPAAQLPNPAAQEIYNTFYGLVDLAVPLFFAFSGYFSYRSENSKRVKRIRQMAVVFLVSSALYFAVSALLFGLRAQLHPFKDPSSYWNLIFDQIPVPTYGVGNFILWYLLTLLALLCIEFISGRARPAVIATMGILGWICGNFAVGYPFLADKIPGVLGLHDLLNFQYGHLFQGALFFAIGYFTRAFLTRAAPNALKGAPLWIAFAGLLILWYFEKKYIIFNGFCIPALVATILLICAKFPNAAPGRAMQFLSNLGGKYSLYIYLIHPVLIYFAVRTIPAGPEPTLLQDTLFFWGIFVATVVISVAYRLLWARIKPLIHIKNKSVV